MIMDLKEKKIIFHKINQYKDFPMLIQYDNFKKIIEV